MKTGLTEQDCYKLALQSNSAAESMVPSTLVTYAEFVWSRAEEGKTQDEIADMMEWERQSVRDYALLRKICPSAWDSIVATFDAVATIVDDDVATTIVATATFTERLLRDILPLEPDQQMELVHCLAQGTINKGKFRSLAENYRARNDMYKYASQQFGELGEAYTARLHEEVYSGAYDADWKNADHPKLAKLIASLRDEWERKNSIHLVHGGFYGEQKRGKASFCEGKKPEKARYHRHCVDVSGLL